MHLHEGYQIWGHHMEHQPERDAETLQDTSHWTPVGILFSGFSLVVVGTPAGAPKVTLVGAFIGTPVGTLGGAASMAHMTAASEVTHMQIHGSIIAACSLFMIPHTCTTRITEYDFLVKSCVTQPLPSSILTPFCRAIASCRATA
jgi:hypothetical protein